MTHKKYYLEDRDRPEFGPINIIKRLEREYGFPIMKEKNESSHTQNCLYEINETAVLTQCDLCGNYPIVFIIGEENKINDIERGLEERLKIKLKESK